MGEEDTGAILKEAARLLRCGPEGVPAAARALQARIDGLQRELLALKRPGPISLEVAAEHGITRVRQAKWANPFDHFELSIHEGKPGPWVRLWAPANAMFGPEQPDGFQINAMGIGTPSVDPRAPHFEPYAGPPPDSPEYRAEAERFAVAERKAAP